MKRSEAKYRGGVIYQLWLDGYKWRKDSFSPNFTRKDHVRFLKNELDFASEATTEMARAFTFGMAAHTRNVLKKGKYSR